MFWAGQQPVGGGRAIDVSNTTQQSKKSVVFSKHHFGSAPFQPFLTRRSILKLDQKSNKNPSCELASRLCVIDQKSKFKKRDFLRSKHHCGTMALPVRTLNHAKLASRLRVLDQKSKARLPSCQISLMGARFKIPRCERPKVNVKKA